MSRLVILFVAAACISMQIIHGADEDEGTFNLIQGNCTYALARDMVYREHVHKYFIPFVERNATSTWYGDETIYCLKALNENEVSEGGIAFLKTGGLNHSYVTIEMHSKRGNRLEYDIEIYAR